MPEPGSHAYDKQRARQRAENENEGLPDKKANDMANDILQGDRPTNAEEPSSDRTEGGGHAGRGRQASGGGGG